MLTPRETLALGVLEVPGEPLQVVLVCLLVVGLVVLGPIGPAIVLIMGGLCDLAARLLTWLWRPSRWCPCPRCAGVRRVAWLDEVRSRLFAGGAVHDVLVEPAERAWLVGLVEAHLGPGHRPIPPDCGDGYGNQWITALARALHGRSMRAGGSCRGPAIPPAPGSPVPYQRTKPPAEARSPAAISPPYPCPSVADETLRPSLDLDIGELGRALVEADERALAATTKLGDIGRAASTNIVNAFAGLPIVVDPHLADDQVLLVNPKTFAKVKGLAPAPTAPVPQQRLTE